MRICSSTTRHTGMQLHDTSMCICVYAAPRQVYAYMRICSSTTRHTGMQLHDSSMRIWVYAAPPHVYASMRICSSTTRLCVYAYMQLHHTYAYAYMQLHDTIMCICVYAAPRHVYASMRICSSTTRHTGMQLHDTSSRSGHCARYSLQYGLERSIVGLHEAPYVSRAVHRLLSFSYLFCREITQVEQKGS